MGLVAMKVLGGAPNNRDKYILPKEFYERAIRYAISVPGMACAVIGFKALSELEQLAQTIAHAKPLSDHEAYALAMAGLELSATAPWRSPYGTPLS